VCPAFKRDSPAQHTCCFLCVCVYMVVAVGRRPHPPSSSPVIPSWAAHKTFWPNGIIFLTACMARLLYIIYFHRYFFLYIFFFFFACLSVWLGWLAGPACLLVYRCFTIPLKWRIETAYLYSLIRRYSFFFLSFFSLYIYIFSILRFSCVYLLRFLICWFLSALPSVKLRDARIVLFPLSTLSSAMLLPSEKIKTNR
jgi:hypothetical protein